MAVAKLLEYIRESAKIELLEETDDWIAWFKKEGIEKENECIKAGIPAVLAEGKPSWLVYVIFKAIIQFDTYDKYYAAPKDADAALAQWRALAEIVRDSADHDYPRRRFVGMASHFPGYVPLAFKVLAAMPTTGATASYPALMYLAFRCIAAGEIDLLFSVLGKVNVETAKLVGDEIVKFMIDYHLQSFDEVEKLYPKDEQYLAPGDDEDECDEDDAWDDFKQALEDNKKVAEEKSDTIHTDAKLAELCEKFTKAGKIVLAAKICDDDEEGSDEEEKETDEEDDEGVDDRDRAFFADPDEAQDRWRKQMSAEFYEFSKDATKLYEEETEKVMKAFAEEQEKQKKRAPGTTGGGGEPPKKIQRKKNAAARMHEPFGY
jgi:hypothetical protein